MSDLQIFNNPEFGELRAAEIDGIPWFVAADICRVLELTNTAMALERLDEDEKYKFNLGLPGGDTWCINEYGLYTLVLGSRKPEAKVFKRWLTHEVLPAIRKTGAYIAPQTQPPATLDAAAMQTFAATLDTLTATVQALVQRMDAQEPGRGEMRALPPMPDRNPFADNPFTDDTPKPSSTLARKMWMRLVNEKLDMLSMRFGKSNNAILHKIYQDMEEELDTVLNDERYRVMEEQGLDKCSVLMAIFFDPELRDYFQRYIDHNLAPENRGW
ncbi:MAG: hypothetical protein HDR88_06020 [Bacteroides sp.]|nr:hypothetical protein [Bacteroides sp.]